MVCYKALRDVAQFYSLFSSLRLLVHMHPYFEIQERLQCSQMPDRANKHNSTNGEEWGKHREYRELGGVWESMGGGGIGEFLIVEEVGSSMGEIWKE